MATITYASVIAETLTTSTGIRVATAYAAMSPTTLLSTAPAATIRCAANMDPTAVLHTPGRVRSTAVLLASSQHYGGTGRNKQLRRL
jgi:hypothetical protein